MANYPNIFNLHQPINNKNYDVIMTMLETISSHSSSDTILCDAETGEVLVEITSDGILSINQLGFGAGEGERVWR